MDAMDYATARRTLGETMERVCRDRDPVIITKRGCAVVMMALADYEALEETDFLLSTPANAERLRRAVESDRRGDLKEVTMEELEARIDAKAAVHA